MNSDIRDRFTNELNRHKERINKIEQEMTELQSEADECFARIGMITRYLGLEENKIPVDAPYGM